MQIYFVKVLLMKFLTLFCLMVIKKRLSLQCTNLIIKIKMKKFIKTETRSKQLLAWAIEETESLKKIVKLRGDVLNEKDWSESELENFLTINSEAYKTATEFIKWCVGNIVSWHLTPKELEIYNVIRSDKTDRTTNYMM